MKERPISFTGESINAILEGRKIQTRRVITVPWSKGKRTVPYEPWYVETDGNLEFQDANGEFHPMTDICPYGKPGDRLWVKETFSTGYGYPNGRESGEKKFHYNYRADMETRGLEGVFVHTAPGVDRSKFKTMADLHVWKSGRFMPKIASRIALEITGVRVERLQDISEADAVAEGMQSPGVSPVGITNRAVFANLWDKINGKKHPWSENCWVWVIEFKKINA